MHLRLEMIPHTPYEPPRERQDWHKLTTGEQADADLYRQQLLSFRKCATRAQWYLHRHFGAPQPQG